MQLCGCKRQPTTSTDLYHSARAESLIMNRRMKVSKISTELKYFAWQCIHNHSLHFFTCQRSQHNGCHEGAIVSVSLCKTDTMLAFVKGDFEPLWEQLEHLSCLAIEDETWLYQWDAKTKKQSMLLRHSGSPTSQKFKTQEHRKKSDGNHFLGRKGDPAD